MDWDPSKCLEARLPDIALFCLRAAKDRHRAAELAERVVAHARRNLSSSAHSASFSAWLYSILRKECA